MANAYSLTDFRANTFYAYGKDGMTFASINNGKEYVEDFTYTSEVRISTLDCSNFTNPYQMLEYTQITMSC